MAAVVPLDDDARTLALLYALWYNFGRDGLHTCFYSEAGSTAPLMRDTLQKAGLTREFEIFSQAMALFGKDYPLDYETRAKILRLEPAVDADRRGHDHAGAAQRL